MHGGKSTGPRTLAGLDRLRTATTKHGAYATSASRRARDPADPFGRHAITTAIKYTTTMLALIRQAEPGDPDPPALIDLLRHEPLPFRPAPTRLPPGSRPRTPHAT
jgi:hypothetical protein